MEYNLISDNISNYTYFYLQISIATISDKILQKRLFQIIIYSNKMILYLHKGLERLASDRDSMLPSISVQPRFV